VLQAAEGDGFQLVQWVRTELSALAAEGMRWIETLFPQGINRLGKKV